jgi:allantoate deiminase
MAESGMNVRRDAAGNLIGRLEGSDGSLPAVMAGSHIDSVIQGGIFDGCLGVIGAIEAVQSIRETGLSLLHPVEVVAFIDEEGVRFNKGYFGSRAMVGKADRAELVQSVDSEGVTRAQAMREWGLDPDRLHEACRSPNDIKIYLELHIEQGQVLESLRIPIGVVKGIAAPHWFRAVISGESGHAGATPMRERKDALAAAAEIILETEKTAISMDDVVVATVGCINVSPGGINIIPGKVELTFDVRHYIADIRDQTVQIIREHGHRLARKRGVAIRYEDMICLKPVVLPKSVSDTLHSLAHARGWSTFPIISGAGHDAMILSEIADVGFLFVPSRGGISHNPAEWTDFEDCAKGVQLLTDAIIHYSAI